MTNVLNLTTTLLLVEDSESDAALFAALVADATTDACAVVRVSTLADAIAFIAVEHSTCAVVDLGLPDAEGLEIVEVLAAVAPTTALIVLTGRDDETLGLAAIEAGAGDYLVKDELEGRSLVRSIRYAILRKRAEISLAEAQSIARLGSWELVLDSRRLRCSREFSRLFGFDNDQTPDFDALIGRAHPDDRPAFIAAVLAAVQQTDSFMIEHRIVLPDGTMLWIRARGRVEVTDGRAVRLHGTAQDITGQREVELALQHQALHDPLSHLPNRVNLVNELDVALDRTRRRQRSLAVLCMDIDRFKVINDSLGHTIGDQVLLAAAARLKSLVRPHDMLARTGGDEFTMACDSLSGERSAIAIADRLRAAMAEPLHCAGREFVLSASIGVAVAQPGATDGGSLLRDAEVAMYRAKQDGRGRSTLFAESMRAKAIDRLDTEVALRTAIANDELRVHYQPIVKLHDGRIIGHEALVRWQHPIRGLLAPDQFIAVAEETGLIVPIGGWVLREACRTARAFQTRHPCWQNLAMSVNLSGAQFCRPDLADLVVSALTEAGLAPEHLKLEMTESMLMNDAAATVTILRRLKSLGVRLGVDDFGTGYSSLAYLKRFPVDVLKIDRTFVNGLGIDPEDLAIARAIVGLGEALNLIVVAEGVETDLQRRCLLELGCSRAQGFLFARPSSAEECVAELDAAAFAHA